MATSADQIKLQIGVEGQAELDALKTRLENIDNSTKGASDTLKQFNVRNVAYQIQDLAVQLSMGTNAFMAIGQQLPQLLSGFGVMGAVIGAVAAVAIPVLSAGLKAAGFDFRSLDERVRDATASVKAFQEAQKENSTSVGFLSLAFGDLAPKAKEFYGINEQLAKQKAFMEIGASVSELKDKLGILDPVARQTSDSFLGMAANVSGINALRATFREWQLGLTAEQAKELGKRINELDPSNMEKLAGQSTELLKYIQATLPAGDKLRNTFEVLIPSVQAIAQNTYEFQKKLEAAAQAAINLQSSVLGIQAKYLPDIGDAKRAFNQIRAIQLEAEQAIAIKRKEIETANQGDKLQRAQLLAAFEKKTNDEAAQKIKDVQAAQKENYLTVLETYKAKQRQLDTESDILKISDATKLGTLSVYQYESDILRNKQSQADAEANYREQQRKGQLSAVQLEEAIAKSKEQQAKADQLALEQLNARVRALSFNTEQQIKLDEQRRTSTLANAGLSDRERKNAEELLNIDQKRAQEIEAINASNSTDKVAQIQKVTEAYAKQTENARSNQALQKQIQDSFSIGWSQSLSNYVESSRNAFESARNIFQKTTKGMEDMIVNFARTGKFEFKSFVASLAEEILRSNVRQLMASLFTTPTAGGSTGGGVLGNIFGSLLGFASGGVIPTNGPVIVGERGPELLYGAGGMTVSPNASAGTYVTYNINAVDASSFKSMIARDPAFIHAVATQGSKMVPSRR